MYKFYFFHSDTDNYAIIFLALFIFLCNSVWLQCHSIACVIEWQDHLLLRIGYATNKLEVCKTDSWELKMFLKKACCISGVQRKAATSCFYHRTAWVLTAVCTRSLPRTWSVTLRVVAASLTSCVASSSTRGRILENGRTSVTTLWVYNWAKIPNTSVTCIMLYSYNLCHFTAQSIIVGFNINM